MLKLLRCVILTILLCAVLANYLIFAEMTGDLSKLLPDKIEKWQLKGKPEVYTGDDLFLYINGGADIYQEYGFEEVISSEYEQEGAGRISVEIYKMNNPQSAFGIFTFKTGGKWDKTNNGNLYSSADYYLNILLGNNLVTITSIDINEETGKGIEAIREELERRIISSVSFPEIVKIIDPEKYKSRVYFKGDLGLMNIYNLFSSKSEILHGASGTTNDSIIFVLEFKKGADPRKNSDRFVTLFKAEKRYSDFTIRGKSISFIDRDKKTIYLSVINGYLVINIDKTLSFCKDSAESFRNYTSAFK